MFRQIIVLLDFFHSYVWPLPSFYHWFSFWMVLIYILGDNKNNVILSTELMKASLEYQNKFFKIRCYWCSKPHTDKKCLQIIRKLTNKLCKNKKIGVKYKRETNSGHNMYKKCKCSLFKEYLKTIIIFKHPVNHTSYKNTHVLYYLKNMWSPFKVDIS